MAHRVYRLSISPEDLPNVRRVLDFDGRASLAEVHSLLAQSFDLDASDHLYAFFTSGRFWDADAAYVHPYADGRRADRALLFRLELRPGRQLAYIFDFGAEHRFVLEVVSVTDVASPLAKPVLVESVGAAPRFADGPAEGDDTAWDEDESDDDQDPPELAGLVELAEDFLDTDDQLDELEGQPESASDESLAIDRASADAALALLARIGGDKAKFFELDSWLLNRSLAVRLLDLPLRLGHAKEYERALALASALSFVDRELMEGDRAVVLAQAGRREEALAQLDANLERAEDKTLVEAKAGDVYRALGDLPAAEAYFRRSLAEARSSSERLTALLRVAGCLEDQGRTADAAEVIKQARQLDRDEEARNKPPAAGRNEPCPCGSGKKYKKCHGA